MATRNKRCAISIDYERGSLTFTSDDGRVSVFNPQRDYTPQIFAIGALSTGWKNKLMDSYSDPESDPHERMAAVHAQLLEGYWRAAGGGEAPERVGLFVEAYARHFGDRGVTIESARQKINEIEAGDDADAKGKLKAMRAHPTLKALMAKISLEKAQERAKTTSAAAKGNKEEVAML